MTKYHINSKGEKAICHANRKPCRFTPVGSSQNGASQESPEVKTSTESAKPKLSAQRLEEVVKNDIRGWDNLEFGNKPDGSPGRIITVDGVEHHIEHVVTNGGGEGGPEHVEVIFKLDNQLWRKQGRYSSYDGTDYEYGDLSPVREEFRYETKYYGDNSSFQAHPPLEGAIEISGSGWDNLYVGHKQTIVHDGNTYKVEVVEDIGGEGEGSYTALILNVNGEMWRKQGNYSSYDGHDYSFGLLEKVTPQEDYVTYYENIE